MIIDSQDLSYLASENAQAAMRYKDTQDELRTAIVHAYRAGMHPRVIAQSVAPYTLTYVVRELICYMPTNLHEGILDALDPDDGTALAADEVRTLTSLTQTELIDGSVLEWVRVADGVKFRLAPAFLARAHPPQMPLPDALPLPGE